MKDISVYNMLGLSPSQIYIVGRPSKKYQNQCQVVQFLSLPLVASHGVSVCLFQLNAVAFPSGFSHLL